MRNHLDERPQWRDTTLQTTLMRNHPDERLQWRDSTLKKDHPEDHPDEKPPWWKTTVKRHHPKLKKDHPDEKQPWWKTTLKKDHPDEKPHTHTESHTQAANVNKRLQTTPYIQILKHKSTSTEQTEEIIYLKMNPWVSTAGKWYFLKVFKRQLLQIPAMIMVIKAKMHTHTRTHAHTHTHTKKKKRMHTHKCTHAHTHTHACTHTYIGTHTHMSILTIHNFIYRQQTDDKQTTNRDMMWRKMAAWSHGSATFKH